MPNILFSIAYARQIAYIPICRFRISAFFSNNNAFLTDYLSFVSVTKSPKSGKIKIQNIPHRKEVLNMRKKYGKYYLL